MFNNFEETKNWIENIKKFGSKLDLSRITKVLEIFGNPQNDIKTIHVGGTNGKGSTSSYLKSILLDAGFKVGIYTSPYVVKFNERISINNNSISDNNIIKYANLVYPIWKDFYDKNEVITFFEVLTVICFLYFKNQKVDFAVIEVGLGGTLDATNVITPIASVITNISYDHMNVLGNTLESIALNKLGIVKDNVPLVTTIEQKELFPLIIKVAKKHNSPLQILNTSEVTNIVLTEKTRFTYKNEIYISGLPGDFQVNNSILAIETILTINQRLNLNITKENIKSGLYNTKWPGRFEIFNHNTILDGAHNIGGILALSKAVKNIYPDKYIKCLVSIMHDKQHDKIINIIDNFADEVYFTEFEYARRVDASILYHESHNLHKKINKDYKKAFKELQNLKSNEILIVTGSLYFISVIRKLIIK